MAETIAIATSGRLIKASATEITAERQTARYGARFSSWLTGLGFGRIATVVIAAVGQASGLPVNSGVRGSPRFYFAALRSTDHWARRIAMPTAHGTPMTAQRFAAGGGVLRIAAACSAPGLRAAASLSPSSAGGAGGPPEATG